MVWVSLTNWLVCWFGDGEWIRDSWPVLRDPQEGGMFEVDLRVGYDPNDVNVLLFNRRSYAIEHLPGEGVKFETRAMDGYVAGDKRPWDWLFGSSYKDRCEVGRLEYGDGEGEHLRTNRYSFRCKLLRPTQADWTIFIQSHVKVEVNNSVYPYGWTFNLAASRDEPNSLRFNYGVWGRPDPKPQFTVFPAEWGSWWDIDIEVFWSTLSEGWAKVFLNGDQVAQHHGANMPTPHTMEMKWGIYRGNRVRSVDQMLFQHLRFA